MYFILSLTALYLFFSSAAQTCENSSYTQKRWWTAKIVVGQEGGRTSEGEDWWCFWGGYFYLFIGNVDLQPCGLQRNTWTLSSGHSLHSSWTCNRSLAWKSLSSVLVIQWYTVSNQLRVRLGGMVTHCTFSCCFGQSLTCEEPRAAGSWFWAQPLGLFLLSVQFLFLPCLCLAAGGPEPKTETCSSLGCFSFLLLTFRYFFF